MVLALAGRRVDSLEAQLPSFPQQNIDLVRQRILSLFEQSNVTVLVCSAACGADLLALEAANTLGRRRRIVIPFNPDRFRESSVADRPGDWVTSFERFVHQAEINGDLVNLRLPETDESYLRTNDAILDEASILSRALNLPVAAALVWDGVAKSSADFTHSFSMAARARGYPVHEVSTL